VIRKRYSIWGLVFLIIVGAIVAGLFLGQQRFIRYHLPLIEAQLANAEAQGEEMLERVGAPADSTIVSPVKWTVYNGPRGGMWSKTPCAAKWTSTWDVSGTQDETLDWYKQRLVADGWEVYNQRIPSTLETLYCKDKWLLTIGHNVSFSTDHPPHAQFQFLLVWDYWHELKQTSQDNVGNGTANGR